MHTCMFVSVPCFHFLASLTRFPLDASYNNLRRVSSGDHSIILRTHEKLLYLRARMVYLHHENATPPPEDKLIEDLLEHAISETRRGRDWNESSYTAVLSCFCGPYVDRAFETISKVSVKMLERNRY